MTNGFVIYSFSVKYKHILHFYWGTKRILKRQFDEVNFELRYVFPICFLYLW